MVRRTPPCGLLWPWRVAGTQLAMSNIPGALVGKVLFKVTRERDMVFKRGLYKYRGVFGYLIADLYDRPVRLLGPVPAGVYPELMGSPESGSVQFTLCDR